MKNAKHELRQIFQKKGKETRKYTISDIGLETEITNNGQFQASTVQFEEIEFNEMLVRRSPNPAEVGLFISVFVNLLLIVFLLYQNISFIDDKILSGMTMGVIGGLSVWSFQLFKKEKEKILKGPQNLFFFYGKNEKDEVDWFIKELKSVQREYVREKYMRIDDLLPHETQEQTFYWMYKRRFISRSELEILFDELGNRKIIRGK